MKQSRYLWKLENKSLYFMNINPIGHLLLVSYKECRLSEVFPQLSTGKFRNVIRMKLELETF